MQLNIKVIKKWQAPPPIYTSTPPFQGYPPFLAEFLVGPHVTQFLKVLPLVNTLGEIGGGGELKRVLRNSCGGVHLLVKLSVISLQACRFTKTKILHTFLKDLSRFEVIIFCVLEFQEHLFFKAPFSISVC